MISSLVFEFLLVFLTWRTLVFVSGCEAPIAFITSESMAPTFKRGDLVFLYHSERPLVVGEIVVFQLDQKEEAIVHRIVDIQDHNILTKGDANHFDDRSLYEGNRWLTRSNIKARVALHLKTNIFLHSLNKYIHY
jgi:signal peptidase I